MEKFLDTILESMCACYHFFATFTVTEPSGFEVFDFRARDLLISFSFSPDIYAKSLGERTSGGAFFFILKILVLLLKLRKSPDLPYYIIDNQ